MVTNEISNIEIETEEEQFSDIEKEIIDAAGEHAQMMQQQRLDFLNRGSQARDSFKEAIKNL